MNKNLVLKELIVYVSIYTKVIAKPARYCFQRFYYRLIILCTGPSDGAPGKSYTYSSSTIDPDGDSIYYMFEWGDDTDSGWLGPYNSGDIVESTYSWTEKGSYEIRVIAKDENGVLSEWSDPLPINMPRYKITNLYTQRIISQLPLFSKILAFSIY